TASLDTPYGHKVIPYVTSDERWYKRFKNRSLLRQMAKKHTHILVETETIKTEMRNLSDVAKEGAAYLTLGPVAAQVVDQAALKHTFSMAYYLNPAGETEETIDQLVQTFHIIRKYESAVTLRMIGDFSTLSTEVAV